MIRPSRLPLILLIALVMVATTGCVSKGKYNSALEQQESLQRERDDLVKEREALAAERNALEEVAIEQEAELATWETDYETLATLFAIEIASNDFQVKRLVDGIEVAIPSDVLYKSGEAKATINDDVAAYAEKIANFLKASDYHISVVGHTDNQQPGVELAKRFPTNWDLAAARAANAVKYFVGQGVDPTRIIAVSRGEFEPVASNDTPEGRAANRRIQIILRQLPN